MRCGRCFRTGVLSGSGDAARVDALIAAALDDAPSRVFSVGSRADVAAALAERFGAQVASAPLGAPPPVGAPFDLALCVDALQTLPEDAVDDALAALAGAGPAAFLRIATAPAPTLSENGENAHRTVRPAPWWAERIGRAFPEATRVRLRREDACAFVTWPLSEAAHGRLRRLDRAVRRRESLRRLLGRIARPLLQVAHPPARLSATLDGLSGRSVALVGNAGSLSAGRHGADIDSADIVIRFNLAPLLSRETHGARTDWLATHLATPEAVATARGVSLVLWLGPSLKNAPSWMVRRGRGFLRFPPKEEARLTAEIGAAPSSGARVMALALASRAASIRLYGFDFMASGSVGSEATRETARHDFDAEARWFAERIASDPRVAHIR